MEAVLLFLTVAFAWFQCNASPYGFDESHLKRMKRADCSSSYGDWSEWGPCSMNCGYCGRQNRTRTCMPVSGCDEPICTGDSTDIMSCGEDPKPCLFPTRSCCDLNTKKTVDLIGKRFYCGPRKTTALPDLDEEATTVPAIPITEANTFNF